MNLLSSTTGSTNKFVVTSDGKLAINGVSFGEQAKPYERLFGMTEDEIYKKFGLIFKQTDIYCNGEPTYEIESDHEAELYLIKKGFLKYVKGKSKWHDQAMDEGWKNGWTPNPDSVVEKKKELGHVYFFKSANSHKVGCSCENNIKNRVRQQFPDEVLAVSPARDDYKKLEKKIHKMFAKNRVARYEIFNDLTEDEVQKIKKMLGNTIAVEIKLRGQK